MIKISGEIMTNGYVAELIDGNRAVFDEISASIYILKDRSWVLLKTVSKFDIKKQIETVYDRKGIIIYQVKDRTAV